MTDGGKVMLIHLKLKNSVAYRNGKLDNLADVFYVLNVKYHKYGQCNNQRCKVIHVNFPIDSRHIIKEIVDLLGRIRWKCIDGDVSVHGGDTQGEVICFEHVNS